MKFLRLSHAGRRLGTVSLSAIAASLASPAAAQDPALPETPAPSAAATPSSSEQRSFPASYFARFAPTTAYDMLVQVPGFTIRSADTSRGLGQASENVLIDGQRVTDKSGGALQQLRTTDAQSVERIDIVDAARLGIAGLQGQVANVILKKGGGGKGQFSYNPEFRAHYSNPLWKRGLVSYTDSSGPFEYTLSADSLGSSNGAYGGNDDIIYDPSGAYFERRVARLTSDFFQPKFKAATKIDLPGSSIANVSAQYSPYWYDFSNYEKIRRVEDSDDRFRDVSQSQRGYMLDFNGDYEVPLGPGRLKFIGLWRYEHEPTFTTQLTSFVADVADDGVQVVRDARVGEFILRSEYGWKGGPNDWQLSLERAVNTLDQKGALYVLSQDGDWEEIPFPNGSGEVAEHRYEGLVTFGRPLSSKADIQVVAGGEISKLERLDEGHEQARTFFRPKGSVSLAWRPAEHWDTSFKISRRVGQISFYDFLAQINLNDDRENAANPDLVPPQSWEFAGEVNRDIGAWGQLRAKGFYYRIDDIVDIIPVGDDEQSIGNLPRAIEYGGEFGGTLRFDPIGWRGAKLDFRAVIDRSSVKDPLTGQRRAISGNADWYGNANLRHDIPSTPYAWGISSNWNHNAKSYYLTEIAQSYEGPLFVSAFVEHKDVFGLTVRFTAGNITGARHVFNRRVYDGFRDRTPLQYSQRQNQVIGEIFSLTIKGNF